MSAETKALEADAAVLAMRLHQALGGPDELAAIEALLPKLRALQAVAPVDSRLEKSLVRLRESVLRLERRIDALRPEGGA